MFFEDGTTFGSEQGSWADISEREMVREGGFLFSLTKKKVEKVQAYYLLGYDTTPLLFYELCACVPTYFFAQKRLQVSLANSAPIWMYTCFGYILNENYRVTLQISSLSIRTEIHPRTTPFPL